MSRNAVLALASRTFAVQFRQLLRAQSQVEFRDRHTLDGVRILITAIPNVVPQSEQRVFDIVSFLRDTHGPAAEVWPADVLARWDAVYEDVGSIDTINHALAALRRGGRLRSRKDVGWELGDQQPELPGLPNSPRQSPTPSAPSNVAHNPPAGDEGARRAARGPTMLKPLIWVPGEKQECGLVIFDARDEDKAIVVTDDSRIGTMSVTSRRTGRVTLKEAARLELVRTDGDYAVVRVPREDRQVRVLILGDWQLKGLKEPEPTPANAV